MRYDLSHEKWKLKALDPYVPLQGNSMETGQELRGITPWVDCTVPGGAALAMYRAGYIDYPYFEMNSLKCEWIENKWWMYQTTFARPAISGKRYRLLFHGVDYDAMIYLNGVLLGEHKGMYESFSYDITRIFEENETLTLKVLIRHAPDEMGQIGKTSETFTQKSRFNYKWDFSTRLVNLGIWRKVEIVADENYGIQDISVTSDVEEDGTGLVDLRGETFALSESPDGLHVKAEAFWERSLVSSALFPVNDGRWEGRLLITDPKLWYPNGAGEQPLYTIRLTLEDRTGAVYDVREYRQGIRRLRYVQNENAPDGALPYTFEINGRKIYAKGVNLVPLDHIYGDIPRERYETTLRAAAAMNVNLVRVWGGGIIETEDFYKLCDQYGLMVWQEFIQSSSGIDNIPSKKPEFLELLEKTARCAVRERRNHTSLTVWSGGNELMDADGIPSTYEDPNIAMLKAIVEELDPGRMFLPTSASGPTEWQLAEPGKSHDVHGDWKYRGNPHHYESYAQNDNLFHSEFGCDGMSGMRTVSRIFAPQNQKPVSMEDSDVWRFHGDWWCTWQRDTGFFGEIREIGPYIAASQWIQAEGLRFILEANRRRQFRNSGSMIWQFNEPWPNVSCTSLYSYFDQPKMAYYWAKDAFSCVHPSFDYRKLNYEPGETLKGSVWVSADGAFPDQAAKVRCELLDMKGNTVGEKSEEVKLLSNRSVQCFEAAFQLPETADAVWCVRVTAELSSRPVSSCYFFSTASGPLYAPARKLNSQIQAELLEQKGAKRRYRVFNAGPEAALHIHAEETGDCANILSDIGYCTLFPGESCEVEVVVSPKFRYGFDEYSSVPDAEPQITFQAFPCF